MHPTQVCDFSRHHFLWGAALYERERERCFLASSSPSFFQVRQCVKTSLFPGCTSRYWHTAMLGALTKHEVVMRCESSLIARIAALFKRLKDAWQSPSFWSRWRSKPYQILFTLAQCHPKSSSRNYRPANSRPIVWHWFFSPLNSLDFILYFWFRIVR